MNRAEQIWQAYQADLIAFSQRLVQLQSYSGSEEAVARCVEEKMRALGYQEVWIDRAGNVAGRMGTGSHTLLLDSHMDTVEVNDADAWKVPPFSGQIVDGRLYGRGSVDMKSALAAAVYAGAAAGRLGLAENKSVVVSGTVCEEFCDGENLKILLEGMDKAPDAVVICEPSDNTITLGQKGKAQMRITAHGVSAHGSAPEKGVNAVYEMADIIRRVEALNKKLSCEKGPHGTVVLSDISCVSASLNAVPSQCCIYLDRRLAPGETEEQVRGEMEELIRGKNASWEVGTLRRHTWTGLELCYHPVHPAWEISRDHPLTAACSEAFRSVFGAVPSRYDFWDFSTNGVTPAAMGIPTIGFGPGEYKLAHMRDENCETIKIYDAMRFYTMLIQHLSLPL